ncbi:hypothetical protein JYT71_01475 [Acidimicrobiaceae bacterium AH-315-P05]|nr:hypothetical protein [Acidimicrobiaceae bacterium AH-315-P05]
MSDIWVLLSRWLNSRGLSPATNDRARITSESRTRGTGDEGTDRTSRWVPVSCLGELGQRGAGCRQLVGVAKWTCDNRGSARIAKPLKASGNVYGVAD